ncbi:MAG TPA: hypothetical protein VEY09_04095 [Pyrinomonadaceae bacterium]|nr:hypothetical protein [Pyrinomonadaceae bacterium]
MGHPYLYTRADDLWVITCFFNPCDYASRRNNYNQFRRPLDEAGINSLTVECVFGEQESALKEYENVVTLRGSQLNMMWQKERLLNLALERLPGHVRKVAWIDSDVLFENPDWAALTSRSLDEYTVVQPFQQLVHLSPGRLVPDDDAEAIESFASVYSSDAGACRWSHFGVHGHTGMAWAARAEVLRRHGLFQVQLSGGADHFMAHAVTGSFESPCFTQARFTPLYKEFREWAKHFYADVGGRLGFVEGRCLHLWHGVREARRYNSVLREMLSLDFRPGRDVFVGENGLLTWSGRNMPLQRWAEQYFWDRSEDLLPQ